MIKARAVAGDPTLGDAFVRGVAPFVYPEHLEPAAIDEVRRTKVRLEEYIRRRGKELTEVKRGRGGIRDVEFAVQLLQIVHGRRDARAAVAEHARGARGARRGGIRRGRRRRRRSPTRTGSCGGWSTVCRSSATCRRTSCRATGARGITLARSLGLADADALQAEYDRTTDLVRGLHERLFYRPLLEAFAGPAAPTAGVDRAATEELLAGLGFASPASRLRGARAAGRPGDAAGQGARARVPGDGARRSRSPPTPTPRSCGSSGSPTPSASGRGPADALADRPGGGAAAGARGRGELVRHRPAGRATRAARGRSPAASPRRTRRPTSCAWSRATAAGSSSRARRATRSPTSRTGWSGRRSTPRRPTLPFAVIGMGKLGARELKFAQRPRRGLRLRGRGAGRSPPSPRSAAERGHASDPRRRVGARRRSASGGPQRPARAVARRVPRVLAALRGDLGVPVAAARAPRGGRRGARTPVRARSRPTSPTRRTGSRSSGSRRSAACASGSSASA